MEANSTRFPIDPVPPLYAGEPSGCVEARDVRLVATGEGGTYSCRNAMIGSTDMARRAGT